MKSNAALEISSEHFDLREGERRFDCRPFVKWVGGKAQLMPELVKRIPKDIDRYFEPFIGGGALLFSLQPRRAFISDINVELINAYEVVKENVEHLIKNLRKHVYEESYFYKVRDADRTTKYKKWTPVQRASRLIFLNKTCYNGLYRVNSKGHFNVPFGSYINPTIVDEENLRACSNALKKVTITLGDFNLIEEKISQKDFVYFDPPYAPLSSTAYFTCYNREGFDVQMQTALRNLCNRLDKRGVRFMLSNSSAPFVLELYKKFNVQFVAAARAINSNGAKRGKVKEVIVTNY